MAIAKYTSVVLATAIISASSSPAFAQFGAQSVARSSACRNAALLVCQTAVWNEATAAFDQDKLPQAAQLLSNLLDRPDMARPASEARRAQALQLLAAIRLTLQDLNGAKEAGRLALAIWQKRNMPAENENRWITHLNLTNALSSSQDFGAAETLARQLLAELGPVRTETHRFQISALELLASILAGRQGPIDELVRRRTDIVALYRSRPLQGDEVALHRLELARALGNLADAQTRANALEPANTSLTEAQELMRSIQLPESDPELVLLRARWLPLMVMRADRCGVEAVALALVPHAEPLGDRILSQILIQHGENYRYYGASIKAAPPWTRAMALELAMACPPQAGRTSASCTGSPVLIDHLRSVGMSLRYEGQGRASAGYRSLVQAGDLVRARTLAGFALNRDSSTAYVTNRDIFRDQITTAWAVNDAAAVPKVVETSWTCPQ